METGRAVLTRDRLFQDGGFRMLGVVIWACQRTGKAIVWCADHRDLAHFDAASTISGKLRIEVGDLVEVALVSGRSVRRCASLKLVEANYMPEVANELKVAGRRRRLAIAAA